MSHNDPISTVK